MVDKKTIDPAVKEMMEKAKADGIITAFDRAETTKACPIGHVGSCCKNCHMGPCRLVGKTTQGICGATIDTVAARNLEVLATYRLYLSGQPTKIGPPFHRLSLEVLRNESMQRLLHLGKLDDVIVSFMLICAPFENRNDRVDGGVLEPWLAATFQNGHDLETVEEETLQSVAEVHVNPRV